MRTELKEQINMFKVFNDITLKNEIVIFGSTYTAEFPFYELSQKYLFSNAIYNRSIKGLTLREAEEILSVCVLEAKPAKLFLSLREEDLENPTAIDTYESILLKIKEKLPDTLIYVIPVQQNNMSADSFNKALQSLCKQLHITYLKLSCIAVNHTTVAYNKIFRQLTCFFRKNPMQLTDIFSMS